MCEYCNIPNNRLLPNATEDGMTIRARYVYEHNDFRLQISNYEEQAVIRVRYYSICGRKLSE